MFVNMATSAVDDDFNFNVSMECDIYVKDDMLAMVIDFFVVMRTVYRDGKAYEIYDDYKQMTIKEDVDIGDADMDVLSNSSLLTYVGEGSEEFFDYTYRYDEYTNRSGTVLRYYVDGGEFVGIRAIQPDGSVTDTKVFVFEDTAPDSIFEIPTDYEIEGEEDEVIEYFVSEVTTYEITADVTGLWVITTKENGNDDPYIELYDDRDNLLADDDDSADDNNAFILAYLEEGETYVVLADFYDSPESGYTLVIKKPIQLPGSGGEVYVNGGMGFFFTPDESGTWAFSTTDSIDGDPFILLYDEYALNLIAGDDDSAGGIDALITIDLEAGELYNILAGCVNEQGTCTLSVVLW